jgi:hypothetical protein
LVGSLYGFFEDSLPDPLLGNNSTAQAHQEVNHSLVQNR